MDPKAIGRLTTYSNLGSSHFAAGNNYNAGFRQIYFVELQKTVQNVSKCSPPKKQDRHPPLSFFTARICTPSAELKQASNTLGWEIPWRKSPRTPTFGRVVGNGSKLEVPG